MNSETVMNRTPNLFQRSIVKLAATRPAAWLLSKLLFRLDRVVLKLSGGRQTATSLLTGIPVIWLTSMGAKSGQPRRTPLLAVVEGERFILFGTNFGGKNTPGWVFNLRKNPRAELTYAGQTQSYLAREAKETEKAHFWPIADALYPGYRQYRQRIKGRDIAVFILEPEKSSPFGSLANVHL